MVLRQVCGKRIGQKTGVSAPVSRSFYKRLSDEGWFA